MHEGCKQCHFFLMLQFTHQDTRLCTVHARHNNPRKLALDDEVTYVLPGVCFQYLSAYLEQSSFMLPLPRMQPRIDLDSLTSVDDNRRPCCPGWCRVGARLVGGPPLALC